MLVRSLTLQRYGAFQDRSVQFGPGLSVVIGANEAGKSTTLEALSDLLWGIPHRSGQDFLHARAALTLEGHLQLSGEEELSVVRRSTGLQDSATLATVPSPWLTAVDSRQRWRESYGLTHAELRRGGLRLCQGEGDLAELVFTARSGQVLHSLLTTLRTEADQLYKVHGGAKSVEVRRAFTDYQQAHAEAERAMASARDVVLAGEALERAKRAVTEVQERVDTARRAVTVAEQRQRVAEHARALASQRAAVAALRTAGSALTPEQTAVFEAATTALQAARSRSAALGEALAALRSDRLAVVVADDVLDDTEEIERLHLQAEAREVDTQQSDHSLTEALSREHEAALVLSDLVPDDDVRDVQARLQALRVPADRKATLDSLVASLAEATRRVSERTEALEDARRRLNEGEDEDDAPSPDAVEAVRDVRAALLAEGSALTAQRAALASMTEATTARNAAMRLAGLDAGAAVPSDVPSAGAVAEVGAALLESRAAVRASQQLLAQAIATRDETGRALEATREAAVPDAMALGPTRAQRDAAVAQVVRAWVDGRPTTEADDLVRHVHETTAEADALADALVAKADAVAHRFEVAQRLADQTNAADEASDVHDRRLDDLNIRESRWTELWASLDTEPTPTEGMDVRRQLEEARAAHEKAAAHEVHAAALEKQVAVQAASLAEVLSAAGRPRPATDLDGLLLAADNLLADADAARESRAVADQQRRAVASAADRLAQAVRALEELTSKWRDALRAAGVPADLDGPGWVRRRDITAEAADLWSTAQQLRRDAAAAVERTSAFSAAVSVLAARHGLDPADAGEAVATLAERRAVAAEARQRADELEAQMREREEALRASESDKAAALDALARLVQQAGVADVADLEPAAERGQKQALLERDVERLQGLVSAAAPDHDLEVLVEELAGIDQTVLDADLENAQEEQRQEDERLRSAVEESGERQHRLRELTTSEGTAELHAQAHEHLALVREGLERYLIAQIQIEVLTEELAAYERKHASPLLDEAGRLLERLTDGRYVGLVGEDRNLKVVGADEERRSPNQLSEGTADQVFLALRLAGIDSLQQDRAAAGAPTLPVVLDDVLMAFDDARAAAALALMAELSERWQIVVFSHHDHLADLAESLALEQLTVTRLEPPPRMDVTADAETVRQRAKSAARAADDRAARPAPRTAARTATGGASTGDPAAVRQWARQNGYQVGERGRVPAEVTAAYAAAHG